MRNDSKSYSKQSASYTQHRHDIELNFPVQNDRGNMFITIASNFKK